MTGLGLLPAPPKSGHWFYFNPITITTVFAFEALHWSPEEIRKQAHVKSLTYGKLVSRKSISLE